MRGWCGADGTGAGTCRREPPADRRPPPRRGVGGCRVRAGGGRRGRLRCPAGAAAMRGGAPAVARVLSIRGPAR